MRQYDKKSTISLTKVLELIGKPAFFLFTIIVIGGVAYLNLLKLFIQKVASLRIPSLPRIPKVHLPSIPRFKLTLPNHKFTLTTIVCAALGIFVQQLIFADLPSPHLLSENTPSLTTKIYDRHGTLLYQIYKNENRSLIKLSDLPEHLIDATLAAEDKNFYHHWGFDPLGLLRAFTHNLKNCKAGTADCTLEGGSTITQQLVKNVLLNREKSLTRKLKELVLAIKTEFIYSKEEILEMYFNQVPYGGTAYGVEEASQAYFGKHASNLNVAESALLAGLPVSPTTLSPYGTNPYLSKARQHQVLERMAENKFITEAELEDAKNTPITLNSQGISIQAPHFVMYIKDLLVKQFGEDIVNRGGLSVTTTLDLSVQKTLQNEVSTELDRLKNMHVGNGAGMVVNPQTGEILAMVGSRNFYDTKTDGQVNIALQPRQPGSSIKPITYTLALLHGLSPSSTIDDAPICFRLTGQPDYCPSNYDGRFHGTVTLRTALASSYNIPAIKLLNSLGIINMVKLAREMGITTWDDPSRFGLSLTLGGGEVTMLDMVQVYSIFATSGYKVPLTGIVSITDATGQSLPITQGVKKQIIPETVAFQINSMLADNSARAPAFGINSVLNIRGFEVAVKTGTTNNLRDNWTFGYTPNLLVATWVGNNDNTPMSAVASGITGASPIWSRTMTQLVNGQEKVAFTKPAEMIRVATSCTVPPKYEYFVKGTEPKLDCNKTGAITETAATTSL
jgi:1A family penicillin-binding protein